MISKNLDESLIPPNVPAAVDALPSSDGSSSAHIKIIKNYIGGSFVDAHDGQYLIDRAPATGKVIAYIPRSKKSDVAAAVHAAKTVHAESGAWRKKSEEERALVLEKIANIIESRIDEFATAESVDTGKPVTLATNLDIKRAVANFRFFAAKLRTYETGCHTMGTDVLGYTLRRPVGVCGLITPWNLPLYLLTWKVAPALAMGNTIVAKCSELTPLTADLLAQVIDSIPEIPRGTFNLVYGYGRECGSALVEHSDVKLVSFTGGTATGRVVGRVASEMFKKVSLELGGKNPLLIFDDCNVDEAVATAKRAAFLNQGEICLCASRIFVQDTIYTEFMNKFVPLVRGIKIGDPSEAATEMGALISLEHRAKVEYYINLATEKEGAKVECGGARPDASLGIDSENGAFLLPTVLSGVSYESRVATEEIFGPVIAVIPFSSEVEAIKMANHVKYGLAASVFTQNLSRAHRVADLLESGMVWTNCWMLRDLRVPFGGSKQSGVGREGGDYSLEFYSEDKSVTIKL